MVKFVIAALALAGVSAALLPETAQAQGRKPFHAMNDEEKNSVKTSEAVDAQYRAALQRTRKDGAEVKVDPWSNMRGTEATPAKKK